MPLMWRQNADSAPSGKVAAVFSAALRKFATFPEPIVRFSSAGDSANQRCHSCVDV